MIYGYQLREAFLELGRLIDTIALSKQEIKLTQVIGETIAQDNLDNLKK